MLEKYIFSEREECWRKYWEENKIYEFNPDSDKPFYSVDTPPPYVSADHLHFGHIMSYSQAEFIVRYKRMAGFEVFYPMGFDDNGLPTERFVEKKYNINKKQITRPEFINKCLEETKIGAETYRKLWSLIGISVDWSKTYSTINKHCQKISQWSFLDLYKKGKIIQREEPGAWCTTCQTAIAQADLEDEENESQMNYINFKDEEGNDLLIATTRPELIPACVALFVNPNDSRYSSLVGKKAIVPISKHEVPIMTDESVDLEFGSGLMMVCTWGDNEDAKKYRIHNLETRAILEADGKLNELAGEFVGMTLKDARKAILEKLQNNGELIRQENISHVLNVHERCGTPVELIKTKQFFINILDIKDELLALGEKMNWYPAHMKQRYIDWVKALQWDWCISRQRYYGVPFPVWYCEKCGELILPEEKDLPVDPMNESPKISQCPKCGGENFLPENDVMDTWMTSSLSPLIVSKLFENENVQNKLYPSSLRPQAFEIIRTWLFYTTVKSFYHFGDVPFKDIMISGHGHDEKGQKISKRLGNYVPPEQVIERYGADAMRYWSTGANLGENLRYSENEIKNGSRLVNKLFNASKFCLSFLSYENKELSEDLEEEDKWIINSLNKTVSLATKYMESYQYSRARNEIDDFFWSKFCDNYLEFIKSRLYGDVPDVKVKSVLYQVLLIIMKLYAPFLPFITEEVYQDFYQKDIGEKSIHLSSWPKNIEIEINEEDIASFEKAIEAVAEIRGHKSDNKLSLGKELDEYQLKIEVDEKHFDFIKRAIKVKNLIPRK
ncbi:valine--tRNA ligase [Candidatus Falkowbacteria bacterium HGW-Falkowbacteria-1]|uniref:Valine--tRNA ligase n=1 Tax=Candidatus Falkowbacteria bacterium HGW-Falkowbacteria-1 TaxID=2013768 RepID=A0A2N2EAQ0_9BACT|nr:MAG: valine--tRNA ligase [Candidatus Falkowbacteria bacterium HGW-Falkowbacteria-1]